MLVDGWPDDIIEMMAWVEVTEEVNTPEMALIFMERHFPLEDRAETESYRCEGDSEWWAPLSERELDGQWREADEGQVGARRFWLVTVVCEGVG